MLSGLILSNCFLFAFAFIINERGFLKRVFAFSLASEIIHFQNITQADESSIVNFQ